MDISGLATAAVALLSPYLVEGSKEFSKKVGAAAFEGVGKLATLIRTKLAGPVAELEAAPEDADNRTLLGIQLKRALKADPEFEQEIRALVQDIETQGGAPVTQIMTVTGDNNQSYQVSGSNNVINK